MTRTGRACIAACAVTAGITAAAGPGFAGAAADKIQSVFITNSGEGEAIPTRATGVTPVDASGHTLTINGTADVSGSKVDASGSTITIQGDPGDALPVQVMSTEPTTYQKRFFVEQSANVALPLRGLINSDMLLKMPAGEKLTVTHVTGGGGGMHDAVSYVRLMDWCKGEQASPVTTLPLVVSPNAEGAWPVVSQDVSFEIGPGRCLHVEVRRQGAASDGITYPMTVIGHVTKVG